MRPANGCARHRGVRPEHGCAGRRRRVPRAPATERRGRPGARIRSRCAQYRRCHPRTCRGRRVPQHDGFPIDSVTARITSIRFVLPGAFGGPGRWRSLHNPLPRRHGYGGPRAHCRPRGPKGRSGVHLSRCLGCRAGRSAPLPPRPHLRGDPDGRLRRNASHTSWNR